jgi:hypothetical protein
MELSDIKQEKNDNRLIPEDLSDSFLASNKIKKTQRTVIIYISLILKNNYLR